MLSPPLFFFLPFFFVVFSSIRSHGMVSAIDFNGGDQFVVCFIVFFVRFNRKRSADVTMPCDNNRLANS